MYRVMRKGSLLIRPGHEVTVYCDAPIETAGTGRRELRGLMHQVRDVMTQRLDAYWHRAKPSPAGAQASERVCACTVSVKFAGRGVARSSRCECVGGARALTRLQLLAADAASFSQRSRASSH